MVIWWHPGFSDGGWSSNRSPAQSPFVATFVSQEELAAAGGVQFPKYSGIRWGAQHLFLSTFCRCRGRRHVVLIVAMPICDQCGGEIEFRIIDGQTRPIHLSGGCWGDEGGWSRSSSDSSRPRLHSSYRVGITYVNPNARCPVCGESVFYYQSPDDGRVFFDELGPPWPKHACTDQGLDHPMIRRALDDFVIGSGRNFRRRPSKLAPEWIAAGFAPFVLTRAELAGTGIRMHGTVFGNDNKTSQPLHVRITPRHRFRRHPTNAELAVWREVGVQRWFILGASDSGLIMIRQQRSNSAVLLSILAMLPSTGSVQSTRQTEIVEVEGETERDIFDHSGPSVVTNAARRRRR